MPSHITRESEAHEFGIWGGEEPTRSCQENQRVRDTDSRKLGCHAVRVCCPLVVIVTSLLSCNKAISNWRLSKDNFHFPQAFYHHIFLSSTPTRNGRCLFPFFMTKYLFYLPANKLSLWFLNIEYSAYARHSFRSILRIDSIPFNYRT